jgi:hypothetical protein
LIGRITAGQLLCFQMAAGFLVAACVVTVFTPDQFPVALILIVLSLMALVRLSMYPRTYNRCRICGKKILNEPHHMMAHIEEHVGRKMP